MVNEKDENLQPGDVVRWSTYPLRQEYQYGPFVVDSRTEYNNGYGYVVNVSTIGGEPLHTAIGFYPKWFKRDPLLTVVRKRRNKP